MIRVQLLGQFILSVDDREVVLPPKVRMLAAYLFWSQGRWVSRERVRGMFWGDFDEEHAAGSLRAAVHVLRRALGDGDVRGMIEVRRGTLRAVETSECSVDARTFEEKAKEGFARKARDISTLITAASLYRGDLLEDAESWMSGDSDWFSAERRRLADTYVAVLRGLTERLSKARLNHTAVEYAEKWRDAEPFSEEACRTLMGLYSCIGQAARAVEEFERCRRMLQEDLGVSPSRQTTDLCRRIAPVASRGDSGHRAGLLKPDPVKRISKDPRRNAGALLVHGEQKVLHGDVAEGIAILKKSLSIYERVGGADDVARARLALGGALLGVPTNRDPALALSHIGPALAHYRKEGASPDLARALLLASEATRECGRNKEAIGFAEEGLEVTQHVRSKNIQARLEMSLAMALMFDYQFSKAQAAFDLALRDVARFYQPHEMLFAINFRAMLATGMGDVISAEGYLREALAIAELFPPLPQTEEMLLTIRFGLKVILHAQDRQEELQALYLAPCERAFDLPGQDCMQSLLLMNGDASIVTKGVEDWLRASMPSLLPWWADMTIRLLVEMMLLYEFNERAARWAAVAARRGRAGGGNLNEGYAYAQRAVALARLGRVKRARVCRCRAQRLMNDPGFRWAPAWLAHADGLIALQEGEARSAERHLKRSAQLFRKIGALRLARMVESDMSLLHRAPAPIPVLQP